jgi:hypothetical protein
MSILSLEDGDIQKATICPGPVSMCCNTRIMTQDEIMQKTKEAYEGVRQSLAE